MGRENERRRTLAKSVPQARVAHLLPIPPNHHLRPIASSITATSMHPRSPSRPPPYRYREFKGPRAAVTTTPLEGKLPYRNAVAQT